MEMIDARRVHELLDYEGLFAALEAAHKGGMPKQSDRLIYQEPNPEGQPDIFIILPAWEPQEGILAKLVTSFPNNKARHNLPTVNSIYVFINADTGVTEAVIDGEAVIFRKTSSDSAFGSKLLSREDAENFLMIGAGGLAPHLVKAHLAARPSLKRVTLWNRTTANAEALAKTLAAEGIDAEVASDLDAAVSEADIISSATMANEPHLKGKLLKPGAHVDLVGSFTPEMREADDDVLKRASIFVDHRQTTTRSGEFLGPYERGIITPDDVRGDLFELCQGKVKGRQSADEITMMKNGGGSHIDYYVAKYLMDRHHGRPFATRCSS
ncbi:ornithine cyclodeaminase family protein [Nitratireductor pacificus]|uniref:Ornithine cyclodeaminase/mu-crystallin n=1 Tax=Nitratireductor pacificus pht-3B TaxID=391937 RepID=K2ML66_9HYPH|nr:ornithine cyclodeaminase [Nitratireductor pacificus]EKF17977.1 ornithine cyclodeaminase/mu-crystallin [Nitratireductor pacificus pht-3B]